MDHDVTSALEAAGIARPFVETIPLIRIEREGPGRVLPVGPEVVVTAGEAEAKLTLRPIAELYAGSKQPPSFRRGPTREYERFFILLETTLISYCSENLRLEYDEEVERLYTLLRRRPDGRDQNPAFGYLQAAARLYMSVIDVSRDELDAVCRRLAQSARTFKSGPTSTTYCTEVGDLLG